MMFGNYPDLSRWHKRSSKRSNNQSSVAFRAAYMVYRGYYIGFRV